MAAPLVGEPLDAVLAIDAIHELASGGFELVSNIIYVTRRPG